MAFDSTFDYAWQVVQKIYADVSRANGYSFSAGSDEENDLRNRIRDDQSLAQITANTYDDAQRRFPAQGAAPSRDAQSNSGPQYTPPPQLVSSVVAAAPPPVMQAAQAAAAGPGAIFSDTSAGPGGPIGPRSMVSTGGGTFNIGGGGGFFGLDMTTLLILGAVGVGAWFLLRKKG